MKVSVDERLARLCGDFSVAKIGEWLERKFPSYDTSRADVISVVENKNDKEYFKSARLLGFVRELPSCGGRNAPAGQNNAVNRPLLVAAVEMRKILTERTSRQAQFNFAKRVLQNAVRGGAAGLNGYPSQGLFFFYDQDQFFRISLVTGEMEGRKFKFNEAKRQSFYINPDRPNNVAKARLSEPLETFAQLKEAFSVETLTKEFYGKLFEWYEWAMRPRTGVTFPNDDSTPEDDRKYNNESIIRLITRLMFTWFIRQRKMVADELFTAEGVKALLKNFDAKSMEDDSYYRAILQNLFFATFNCQPEKRAFIKHKQGNGYSDQHNIKTLFRYEKEFRDSAAFMTLVKKTPFLNCALFDCLDKQEREVDGGRLLLFDGFSDNRKRQAHVPNGLFFHPEKGIIQLFDTYEFTIDENNADDADVALDPELLGKVFENLLGAFNPETQETARKATGSFYTPREIVDYMVEESLKNHIKTKLMAGRAGAMRPSDKTTSQIDFWLKELFEKTAAAEKRELPFDDEVAAEIREALYSCKILDPACGSGAFPMGILHCMVRLFGRLDPANTDLNTRLIKRYKHETNQPVDPLETAAEREERLAALKVQLDEGQHYPDYARKLYLIENCIYGVDIQPIATQISKLRFFISLLCDQLRENWEDEGENHGLLSLPNLEAKFVCANTLISLPKTEGELELMSSSKIPRLREKLQQNRHRIFAARTFKQKEKLKTRDLEIRDEIRETVRSTLAKPDKELIKLQEGIIAKLRRDRKQYEEPKMEKRRKAVQGDLFGTMEQGELEFEMVDLNKPKRDQIDAQIDFAQKKIDSENAKSSAENVTAIDRLATLVAGWDPYDQNASSPFFDPEWIFNLTGFDVVIGNPPYVQLQANAGALAKLYMDKGYETFDKTGDLYCLFYERGWQLLAEKGILSYITSDKWMCCGYGENLRRFILSRTTPILLIDFSGRQLFDTATVETNVLMTAKNNSSSIVPSCVIKDERVETIENQVKAGVLDIEFSAESFWVIKNKEELAVQKKVDAVGIPLSDWNVKVNFGIKTGLDEAFLVDNETRLKLIREDSSSKKIIKPIFRGKDIGLYLPNENPMWVIGVHNGYGNVDAVDIKMYPAVRKWLDGFRTKLQKRADKGRTYFHLRDCAYWKSFSEEKVMWKRVGSILRFCYSDKEVYGKDTTCMLTGEHIKYLTAFLNSKMGHYLLKDSPRTGTGDLLISVQAIEPLKVVKPTAIEEKPIVALVDSILAAKKKDPDADTSALEREIDQLVYKLYDLTPEEIAIVEGRGAGERNAPAIQDNGSGGALAERDGHSGGAAKPRRRKAARFPIEALAALHSDDDEELE